jgi:hypothetical protein
MQFTGRTQFARTVCPPTPDRPLPGLRVSYYLFSLRFAQPSTHHAWKYLDLRRCPGQISYSPLMFLSRAEIHRAESKITDVPDDHDHGLASVEHCWRPSPRGRGCFVRTTVGFSPRSPLATASRSKFRAAKRRADHHLEVGTRSDYAAAIQRQEPRNKLAKPNGISDCADRPTDML